MNLNFMIRELLADYVAMPRRIDKMEQRIEEIFKLLNEKKSDSDKGVESN